MLRPSLGRLLLALCLIEPSFLLAQRTTGGRPSGGVIDVQVRYANGEPGPRGIHVRLEAAEGGPAGDCETVEGGKCQFSLASSGVYMVRMSERGYKEMIVRVELIGMSRGFATLELKPVTEEAPSTASRGAPDSGGTNPVSALNLSIPENARHECEKGQKSLDDQKLDEGISHLKKAVALYDAFPQAHVLLGTAYLQKKMWTDAQSSLERATQLDPNLANAYLELGAVFNQTKDYPKAEAALKRGLELAPDAVHGHYELAKTYWALGRWQDAAPHATLAVAGLPNLAPTHVLMGNILLRKNDPQGALREYQEYLRLDPNGAMAAGTREMIEKIQKALNKK